MRRQAPLGLCEQCAWMMCALCSFQACYTGPVQALHSRKQLLWLRLLMLGPCNSSMLHHSTLHFTNRWWPQGNNTC